MTAPVLTSLPTPAATAPGRAAAALGQGSGVPIQGFSALLNAAQTPVQTPVHAPVQPPVQASAQPLAPVPAPDMARMGSVPTSVPASVDLLSPMAAAPTAPATAPAPATPALPPPAIAAQPSAAPIAPSGLDTLTEAQNLPEDTGTDAIDATDATDAIDATDATEAEDTGPEAMGPEAITLPDPTTPQTQPAIPSVAAQVAQPTSEPDTGDKPDLTKDPEASEVPSLAAPTLPMTAPLVPAPPTAPVPTGDSAPNSPALSAEAAPLAPAETAPPPTLATTEGSVLAAPQPALPGSAPAPLATAPLPQTLDLAAPQWPEQMVQDIRQSASAALDNLTLTLTPERLGPLQIRLETQDGVTHVHIVTETPEAARAMAEAQPRLAEAMARAGLEMGSQSTTTTGGSGGAAGFGTTGGDANPRGNGHPGTEPGPQGKTTAFDDTASQPLSPRAPARSSIDLIA